MPSSINAKVILPKARSLKINRLEARVSLEQKQLFQKAANLQGRTLTDFIIGALQETAMKIIQDNEILKLTDHDKQIFVKHLLAPPLPNERLRKAVKHYQEKVNVI